MKNYLSTLRAWPHPGLDVDKSIRNLYLHGIEVHLWPEREAQLNDYAHRHGQDPAALDEGLADALEWERQGYQEAVRGIANGYADLKAGTTRSVEESFEELRMKHGLPR